MTDIRVLAVVAADGSGLGQPMASSISELADKPRADNVDVRLVSSPSVDEFQALLSEYKPTVLYFGAKAVFDQKAGALAAFAFKDGSSVDGALSGLAGKGVETLFVDAKADFDAEHLLLAFQHPLGIRVDVIGSQMECQVAGGPPSAGSAVKALQSRGDVAHAIAWPASASGASAALCAQFCRSFFAVLLSYAAPVNEAFTMASHVVQAHCTTAGADGHVAPPLPVFLSPLKAELPDNNSIPPLDMPGMDPTQSIASLVPGWSDLRLLAPRAEVRLLLTGNASLVDSHKLTFLGEALRALLIMETRSMKLVSTSACNKVPINLASGCGAMRCELKTASGRPAVVVLGGQPSVLKDNKLVEHALRMTLVSDSQSLQFRLPPPGVAVPPPRVSAAIAGGTPVVDTLVLSSVWAVQVLRALCEDASSLGLISMGVAAVGSSPTAGLSPADVQRLKMLVLGGGPAEHPQAPIGADVKEAKEEPGDAPPPPPPALAGTGPSAAGAGSAGGSGDEGTPPPPPFVASNGAAAAPAAVPAAAEPPAAAPEAMDTDAPPAAQAAAPAEPPAAAPPAAPAAEAATDMDTDVPAPPAPA